MIDDIFKKIKYDEIVCWDKNIPHDLKGSFNALGEYLKKYNTLFIDGHGVFADDSMEPEEVTEEEKGYYRFIDGKYYCNNTWEDMNVWISDAKCTRPTIDVWNLTTGMEFFDTMIRVEAQAIKNILNELQNNNEIRRSTINKEEYFKMAAEDLAMYFLRPAMNNFDNFCIEGDYMTRTKAIEGIKAWLRAYYPDWADKTSVEFVPEEIKKKQSVWMAKKMLKYIDDGIADYKETEEEKEYNYYESVVKEYEEIGGGEIEDKPFEKFLEAYKR